jgi:hypothetical protein
MDLYEWPQTRLTISLLVGLYLAIKMDRCEGPKTPLIIALLVGFYLTIKMDCH